MLPASVFILAAAFFSPWTGVRFSGLNLADFALLLAMLLCVLEILSGHRGGKIQFWMVAPGIAGISVLTVNVLLMGMPLFTEATVSRSVVGDAALSDSGGGVLFLTRLLIATSVVAFLVSSEVDRVGRHGAQRILTWFALGSLVSAFVGLLEWLELLPFELSTYHILTVRSVGLAFHPNSLALAALVALPIVIWRARDSSLRASRRAFWFVSAVVLSLSLYAADSRAGLVVGVVVIGVSILITGVRSGRNAWYVPGGLAVVLVMYLYAPAVFADSRLFNVASGAQESSDARERLLQNAFEQFFDSPFVGAGLGNGGGVMVAALVLSSGGIVLAIGYYAFLLTPVRRMMRGFSDSIVAPCLVSAGGLVAMSFANNSLSERFDYWTLCVGGAVAVTTAVGNARSGTGPVSKYSTRFVHR